MLKQQNNNNHNNSNPQDGTEYKPNIIINPPYIEHNTNHPFNNNNANNDYNNIELKILKNNQTQIESKNNNNNLLSLTLENNNNTSIAQRKISSIYAKRYSQLQQINEEPRASLTETVLENLSIDEYDYEEQALPSRRNSSDSYQLKKPKTSVINANGLTFHLEDIVEVGEDSIQVKAQDGHIDKLLITNQLTHKIYKINKYYKKPAILKPLYKGIDLRYAWLLLLANTLANGIIPAWIQYIPADKYLRQAWRFFLQFFLVIPFAMYEYRNGDEKIKKQYTLAFILNQENLQKIFMCSFTMSTWFAFTLFCFEWTYVSHAVILGNLVSFYLFLQRVVRKEQIHYVEIFGGIITFLGVSCVLCDSLTFDVNDLSPSAYFYKMTKFIHRPNWQRLIFGNGSSLLVSFLMAKMLKHQKAAKDVFAPQLFGLLTFLLNSFNLTILSYFLSGMDFKSDTRWGWLGLFSEDQFSTFFLMSILLGMGVFVSASLINKIFEPLVPQVSSLFEPVISTLSLDVLGVQIMPMGLSCLGYALILPGLFSIILGQFFIQQQKLDKK